MSWSGRVVGIDLLRGVAAFGIVGCHIQLVPRTCAGNLVVALCDFNVGLFAALAGFLMCGAADVDGWLGYARKRMKRLLPAYFAWTVVFVVLTALFDIAYDGGCLNPRYMDVWFWLRVLFIGGCATHLWFLACLFYAQIAFFGLFASFKGRWWGFAWIAAGAALVVGSALLPGWIGRYPLRLVAFLMTGFGIGCCYRDGVFRWLERRRWIACGLAVAFLVAHVAMMDRVHGHIRDWLAVGPVLLAFVGMRVDNGIAAKAVAVLGATSMGVYLIHPLATRALSVAVGYLVQPPYPASAVLFVWMTAWCVSFAAAVVLRRVAVMRMFL